jgi:hypothetical protein
MINFCVLCLSDESVLTDEHLFPEALGGRIHYPILCGDCNSDIGRRIDAPFLNQKNMQLARAAFQISGKKGNIPQPFSDTYSAEMDGTATDFKIRSDFSASLIPSAPEISITKDGHISISLSRDVEFSHQIPKIIETALRRFFASQEGAALGWSISEQDNAIRTSIESAAKVEPTKTNISTELSGSWEIDLRRLFAEHVKIIYEIACIETLGTFARTFQGEKIRTFLHDLAKAQHKPTWSLDEKANELKIAPILPEHLTNFMSEIAKQQAHTYHMAIASKEGVIVNTLGFGAMMHIERFRPEEAGVKIYFNSIKDGRYGVHDLSEFISL